ncbi:dCTP deaminase [Dehalococcoidales bacterium]|nr:dCTP deaminase [Dehalococcoidales bacterium]
MSDKDIQEARSSGELIIRDFSPESLQPASYDMRLGEEAYSSHEKGRIDVKSTGSLVIKPGDFILVCTHESVKLSPKIAGRIGLRSFWARKGLALLAGPQIDPGFEGVLVVGLHNLDANELKLPYQEPFCTVEFYRLSEPAQQPYQGEYQNQKAIREQDSAAIKERIAAWAPVDNRLKKLEEKVNFLLTKYQEREVVGKKFKFDWEGGLSDLKEKFTSVELQHKILEWR